MKLSAELVAFSDRLGHRFDAPELLIRALTHASISGTNKQDNQRLEFLGDRVLGLVIADALLTADKAAREGQLAPRFNALVRKETCADIAREIDVHHSGDPWVGRSCNGQGRFETGCRTGGGQDADRPAGLARAGVTGS